MADRYRVGRPDLRLEPWRGALAIEDYAECPPLAEPSIIAWTTRGGDQEGKSRKIVDALNRRDLFVDEPFRSHSGLDFSWKIDCDALTDADLATLAARVYHKLGHFHRVVGVPRGGLRFAAALEPYASPKVYGVTLVVDDVLTTGASIEEVRDSLATDYVIGIVIFARAPCPRWIRPIFSLAPWVHP